MTLAFLERLLTSVGSYFASSHAVSLLSDSFQLTSRGATAQYETYEQTVCSSWRACIDLSVSSGLSVCNGVLHVLRLQVDILSNVNHNVILITRLCLS